MPWLEDAGTSRPTYPLELADRVELGPPYPTVLVWIQLE